MQYQVPPKPAQNAPYSVERSFFQIAQEDTANNDPFHQPSPQAENLGGIFVPTSGTTSMSASSTVTTYSLSWDYVPHNGPLPAEELKLGQMRKNMEQEAELKND